MTIVVEYFRTRSDRVKLIRTYSDCNKRLIRNDGVVYDDAIDVENSGYTYTESTEDIITIEEGDYIYEDQ